MIINWLFVLYAYLVICGVVGVAWIAACAHSDIFIGPDHKFGYNYKSSFSYIVLVFVSLPGLNIITVIAFLFIWFRNRFSKRKTNAKSV